MRLLGILLIACVVLAAIKAAIMALTIILVIAFVVALLRQPREMIACITVWGLIGLAAQHPGWAFGLAITTTLLTASTRNLTD